MRSRNLPGQHLGRRSPVLASVLAAAAIVLVLTGCSNITPLGPGPAQLPSQRHLGSPIVVQVMRIQAPTASGGCPPGWVAVWLPAGGGPRPGPVTAVPVGPPTPVPAGAAVVAASPAPPTQSPPLTGSSTEFVAGHSGLPTCYRPVGSRVTIASAAVSAVLTIPPPPGQSKEPALYGFIVGVPGADVAAVTAVIRQAYNSGSALGISVAGKLWQAPMVAQPFAGQRLQISLLSRAQALQLHRLLLPSG